PRPRRRHHCAIANASPVSSTCWMPQWNAAGTRVSNACVSATGSVSVSRPAVPIVSRAGSSEPSTSDSEGALSCSLQNESSPTHAASCARNSSRCDHRRNEVPRAVSAGTSPRAIAAHSRPTRGTQTPTAPPATRKRRDVKQNPPGPPPAAKNPPPLQNPPSRRRNPPLRPPRMLADARLTRPSIKTANVDPPDAGRRIHRPSRRHLQLPLPPPRHLQPQTQPNPMITHTPQRQYHIRPPQPP